MSEMAGCDFMWERWRRAVDVDRERRGIRRAGESRVVAERAEAWDVFVERDHRADSQTVGVAIEDIRVEPVEVAPEEAAAVEALDQFADRARPSIPAIDQSGHRRGMGE